jgi:hypothetical protein
MVASKRQKAEQTSRYSFMYERIPPTISSLAPSHRPSPGITAESTTWIMEGTASVNQARGGRLFRSHLAVANTNANAKITPRSISVCSPVSCCAISVSK